MPEREARLPCPACLGVMMEKLKPVRDRDLVLDTCRRCGGTWFDAGEVKQLRLASPKGLGQAVTLRDAAFRMPCHACHVPMDRNAARCPSCGWTNILDCPVCQKPLERLERNDLVLDACRSCKGVWFDNHELAQIWNLEMTRHAVAPRKGQGGNLVADYFLFEAVLWAPDLLYVGAHGVAHGAGALIEGAGAVAEMGVGGVAELAGGATEAVSEAAGSVFEVIAEILGGLFG